MNNKKGISLIVLIVAIVVLFILTSAIIISLGDIDYADNLDEMSFKNDLSVYAHEIKNVAMNMYNEDNQVFKKTYTTKEEIKKFSSEIVKSDYIDFVVIKNGELVLKGSKLNDIQKEWASQIHIEVDEKL